MTEKSYADHREFERHPIDFSVEVCPAGDQANTFCDSTNLENISGGGVCFGTLQPESYFAGQHVTLKVQLPGTDEVDASMECQAKVVWIHFSGQVDDEGHKYTLIGVCLDGFMSFESQPLQDHGHSA
ncbi:MAG: hypothetical protein CO187_10905 [Zetaproteobacteria bacterium CG_4_9_14_3_um_filter_53_7]|nr:MAG: hypothetical protein CO187_10905 [Zetaproteobacteria bacterium CG_4_9_14_3_um_filter_53_7]